MGHSRQDEFFDVAENSFKGLALLRSLRRKRSSNFSRLRLRKNGERLDSFVVVGNPVHDLVAVFPELIGVHVEGFLCFEI